MQITLKACPKAPGVVFNHDTNQYNDQLSMAVQTIASMAVITRIKSNRKGKGKQYQYYFKDTAV